MSDISPGAKESISHLSLEQQNLVIKLTREFGKYLVENEQHIYPGLGYWEETIEHVEQTKESDIRRLLRNLKRL